MIKARGQLKHHFWGTYHATIVVVFASENDACMAMPLLGDGWKVHPTNSMALSWHGNDEAYVPVETRLISFGADPDKIASIAKSIDHGEVFEITIP